jgi:HEAT repeat protein
MNAWHYLRAPCRLAGPALLAVMLTTLTLNQPHDARAEYLPTDRVEDFRQALKLDPGVGLSDAALEFRQKNLNEKAAQLTSLGDMSRALLLQEWRAESPDPKVSAIDGGVRADLMKRFKEGTLGALESKDSAARAAAAALLGETAVAARNDDTKTAYVRSRFREDYTDTLIKQTEDTEQDSRLAAVYALGLIQADPKKVLPVLGKTLKHSDARTRRLSAKSMTSVVQVAAQYEKKLRGSATAEARAEREKSREDLQNACKEVITQALPGLNDADPEVRRLSVAAIEQVSFLLVDRIRVPNPTPPFPPTTRQLTAEEIARINRERNFVEAEEKYYKPILDAFAAPEVAAALSKASLDPDPEVRVLVRRVLEEVAQANHQKDAMLRAVPKLGGGVGENRPQSLPQGRPEVLPAEAKDAEPVRPPTPTKPLDALVLGLKDPEVRGRLAALDALEAMGEDAAPAIPALAKALSDPDRFVRWAASRILRKLAPKEPQVVVPALTARLVEPDLDVRIAAITALERYGAAAKGAVPALTQAVNRGDPESRMAVLRALDAIGTDAVPALPAIAAALNDDSPRVRAVAAEVLGHFGPRAAAYEPNLRKALADPEFDVRKAASEALLKVLGK